MGGLRITIPAAFMLLAGCGEAPHGAMCVPLPETWRTPEGGLMETDVPRNGIRLTKREIVWNGTTITPAQLHAYLGLSAKEDGVLPSHIILSIAEDADCETVREVITEMKRAPICRDKDLCGTIERWPEFSDPPPPDENVVEGK